MQTTQFQINNFKTSYLNQTNDYIISKSLNSDLPLSPRSFPTRQEEIKTTQNNIIINNNNNNMENIISLSSSSSSSSIFSNNNQNENNLIDNNQDQSHSNSRPSTPPTPCSSIIGGKNSQYNRNIINYESLLQNLPNCSDYLQLIEPNPVSPPTYETLPPGGCPKYPINFPISTFDQQYYDISSQLSTISSFDISSTPTNEKPPTYSPAIYKIGIVARKVEWNNPFELSSNRSWRYFIAELNSTQLNLYNIPTQYETQIFAFNSKTIIPNGYKYEKSNNSIFTNINDHQFYDYVKKLGLLDDNSYNSKKKGLVRSYSLQHMRLGLATDYKKKVNVLRLRIENEQILLNFGSIQDLIDWNLSLNVGKDVSIDISERELPRYRTVPRRRRRRERVAGNTTNANNTTTSNGLQLMNNRIRSSSDPNKLKGSLSKLKLKLIKSRHRNSRTQSFGRNTQNNNINTFTPLAVNRSRSESDLYNPLEISVPSTNNNHQQRNQPTFFINNGLDYDGQGDDDEDDDEYDEEFNEVLRRSRNETSGSTTNTNNNDNNNNDNNDDQEDIQNMSDLPHSDDEDDEEEEEEDQEEYEDTDEFFNEQQQQPTTTRQQRSSTISSSNHHNNLSFSYEPDFKWNPPLDKPHNKRKYYKNCLRCIKPLTMEDSWCSKPLVKPTTLSPLEMAYLRIVKYAGPTGELLSTSSSSSSLYSLGKKNNGSIFKDSTNTGYVSNNNNNGGRSMLILPDVALTRLPNHFLKEFLVGSHGLIPREII
ncbi:hypothetical protein KGF54_000797 [Candida jiufengensis]|uniref:uncharacterized protein n=1 Tax=Candida jiufengensis TaxID=497108 RepID=UPI002225B437|nr:uncharacterized protein KGF54_000797 [Candida jiufengensis]KAI5956322.1 hypothetical protein KGF54_000797 [Candida jiufengensis]